MKQDEGTAGVGVGSRWSELEVVKCPFQSVHALLTAIDGDDDAIKVPRHRLPGFGLRIRRRKKERPAMTPGVSETETIQLRLCMTV